MVPNLSLGNQQGPSPAPNNNGLKKIIRNLDAPARWYTVRTHARKTTSSVMGAYIVDEMFRSQRV